MKASYPIRPTTMSELPQALYVGEHAFNSNWPTEGFLEHEKLVFEPERSLAAFDGDTIIGTATIMSFDLTVPGGGQVGTAGVTGVAVLPTHRRRGVLSSLMDRQLADIAAGHEPVAALFASESAIYGRYGYGAATSRFSYTIRRGEGQLDVPADAPRLRIVPPKEHLASLKHIYAALQVTRPGMLTRSDRYWSAVLADPEFSREGSSPQRCVLAEDEAGPRGYALYGAVPKWGSDGVPAEEINVYELFGVDLAATTALWSDLLSRDLVSEVNARGRAVDDPLQYQIADRRRLRPRYADGMWVRLVDVPTALAQRSYAAPIDVVIEVADERLPANSGRWRLQAGGLTDPAKPSCERSTADPDLVVPVAALGAGYLGGTRLGGLAAAGQIGELRPGAVAELSAAMWWDPAPWAPTSF